MNKLLELVTSTLKKNWRHFLSCRQFLILPEHAGVRTESPFLPALFHSDSKYFPHSLLLYFSLYPFSQKPGIPLPRPEAGSFLFFAYFLLFLSVFSSSINLFPLSLRQLPNQFIISFFRKAFITCAIRIYTAETIRIFTERL